jgi:ATP-binding cassette subfamily F protein 3
MKTLISVHDLRKSYGRQEVLTGLSFVVTEKQRIALIGRNGAGKTTLLRILTGKEEADGGEATIMPDARLGALDQHEVLPSEGTTVGYLEATTGKPEWECRRVASRFALDDDALATAPGLLSGGFQIRVKVVRMMLGDPNLLLLDEPVNYLDLPTLVLFEAFLKEYRGALVVTSHDREVLRNLCTTTWEVERGKLVAFDGDLDTYLDWKDEQEELRRRTNRKLRLEINRNQKFVDRFRAKASQASRAQSKVKHISKLRGKLRAMSQALPTAAFSIRCERVPDGPAVITKGLSVGYGGVPVVAGIDLEVRRGAKVVLVGENGRGKSTILRTLAGELAPVEGEVKWWKRADIGYYSQMAEETLSPSQTVVSALTAAALPGTSAERILATAGAFLFKEDDLEKPCGVLSGGEQARVRLARLILQERNVLLLDEPTNHLDAETVEVLARALQAYEGTVILVSHARTFTNAFAKDIYEIQDGKLRHFTGSFEEYVNRLVESAAWIDDDAAPRTSKDGKAARAAEKQERKQRALVDKQRRREQESLEKAIAKLDRQKSEILAWYFDNPLDYAPDKATRLHEIEEEMAVLEKKWMKLEEAREME